MRGGKRVGAGRKAGSLTKRTRKIAEQAAEEGKTPLEVMLENMRHFQKLAIDAEATIANLTVEEISGEELTPQEQFKLLLAKAKQAAGVRQMAEECARDAAPFIHSRLSAVTHSGEITTNKREMSDDELARIASRSSEGIAETEENSQVVH